MKYVNVEQLLNRLRGMISVREMERIKAAIRACAMVEVGYEEDELRLAMAALEKQEPKKPLYENIYGDCAVYSCPVCKDETMILNGDNYCTMCGQKLDWGGDDND